MQLPVAIAAVVVMVLLCVINIILWIELRGKNDPSLTDLQLISEFRPCDILRKLVMLLLGISEQPYMMQLPVPIDAVVVMVLLCVIKIELRGKKDRSLTDLQLSSEFRPCDILLELVMLLLGIIGQGYCGGSFLRRIQQTEAPLKCNPLFGYKQFELTIGRRTFSRLIENKMTDHMTAYDNSNRSDLIAGMTMSEKKDENVKSNKTPTDDIDKGSQECEAEDTELSYIWKAHLRMVSSIKSWASLKWTQVSDRVRGATPSQLKFDSNLSSSDVHLSSSTLASTNNTTSLGSGQSTSSTRSLDIEVLEQAYATTKNEGHKGTMKHFRTLVKQKFCQNHVIRMNNSSNTENDEYIAAAQDDQKMFMNMNGKPRMKRETETLSDQGTNNSGHGGFGFRIQQDNTLRAAHVIQYAEKSLSVGFLSYQNGGGGTAFRIGPKYVMTASHVVDYITDPYQVKVYDFSQVKTKARVRFGDSNARRFALKGLDIFTSRELDITILELDDGDLPYAPSSLKLLSHNVFENKSICDVAIIGYGHLNTEDKRVTHSARILHKDSVSENIQYILGQWKIQRLKAILQDTGKNPDIVDKGYNGYDCPHGFLFNTYVGPGSSGSPIFTKADPSSLEVVGVYTCGYPELAYHLPDTDQYPIDWTFESGVRMSSIYEAIMLKDQTLFNELFS